MGLLGALGSIGTSIINNYAEDKRAQIQRKWSEEMMDKENEWSLNMWNKTNEYNDPSQQVARLTNAGLNPLYYGLDGSSANGLESAQPLNYERGSAEIANPYAASLQEDIQKAQKELLQAQKDNVDADTNLKGSQKDDLELDIQWKRDTLNARKEAEDLKNQLTRKEIRKIDKEIVVMDKNLDKMDKEMRKMDSEIRKIDAEAETELGRKLLVEAETNLKKMSAQQIVELLPYQKLLMSAQTSAEKAAAAASWMKVAYDAKLIGSGYIEAMTSELKARAKNEEEQAKATEWINAIHSGDVYDPDSSNGWFGKGMARQMNAIYRIISEFGEVLKPFMHLIGLGVGGSAAGRGFSKGAGTRTQNNYYPSKKAGEGQFGPSFTYNSDGSTNWSR